MSRCYSHRFKVKAPVRAVAAFHHDSRVLKLLTPPPIFIQMHRFDPLAEGSVADFTLWLGPLPVRWVAIHSKIDPLLGFTDTQLRGPFATWIHRHSFEPCGPDETEVIDEIQAELGRGFSGLLGRLMWINLPFMFFYRGWITRRAIQKRLATRGTTRR
jgi:ligand-binding SRPBCC domain-containing protein